MEDFSAPSFSLGLDFDTADLRADGEKEGEAEAFLLKPSRDLSRKEEEGFVEPSIGESEQELGVQILKEVQEVDPPRILRRLRRGLPPGPRREAAVPAPSSDVMGEEPRPESPSVAKFYDEIEEFSSPEKEPRGRPDDFLSGQSNVACSSSKFSLVHRGVVADGSDGKKRTPKVTPSLGVGSTLTSLDSSSAKNIFPRLTISPIRKINLIDSDSDSSSSSKRSWKNEKVDTFSRKGKQLHEQYSNLEQHNIWSNKHQMQTFWEDFSPKKGTNLATPVLDEFCKEYLSSGKDKVVNRHLEKNKDSTKFSCSGTLYPDGFVNAFEDSCQLKSINGRLDNSLDSSRPQPPSYKYFYNSDPRIRALVRQCLPHFHPIGVTISDENKQNQFSSGDASGKSQGARGKLPKRNSMKKPKNQSCFNVTDALDISESWLNPRSKPNVPKDAGKRRVSADGRQSGHWFTGQDGKKVYVTKSGQELTGQPAYRQYRKVCFVLTICMVHVSVDVAELLTSSKSSLARWMLYCSTRCREKVLE
ncbi:hypothetical protein AXF42_Ash016572 [Apostasia shenzhenica]|uniref:Uncharacterized protein n=1 Tax=Apostasia shenzhenica TaxID=1088818 RepID=A0A2I0AVI2_9ASPA|nr:hypothetical protein AXF42_Ash016572 [Apostasia shenzhenica]